MKIIDIKKEAIRYSTVCVSLLLSAILYNLFLEPMSIVAGGANGIAITTKALYNINSALMIFIISMACVVISMLYLGKKKTVETIFVSILYPLLVQLTSFITNYFPSETDPLLLIIFAGALGGISTGLVYKTGFNNGGLSVIAQALYEKKQISMAKTNLIMNGIIVIIGGMFFGSTRALYAIIYLYITRIVTDKVLLGISNNKAFYIITNHEEEVKEYITNTLKHAVTVFDVKGGFLETKRRVILTVIPSREYYRVTEGIKAIDENVFFSVTDSYQVEGAK